MATIIDWASVDQNKVDPPAVKAAGIRGVGLRAVYGRGGVNGAPYIDPTWNTYASVFRALKMKVFGYLFLCTPQKSAQVHTPDPVAQADAMADYCNAQPGVDYPPALDVEEASDVLSPAEYYNWVLAAATQLRKRYGVWPMIYTAAHIWAEYLDSHPPGKLLACPLWLAKPWPFAVGSPIHLDGLPQYSPITIPGFGSNWFLYQDMGDATGCPGISGKVDVSRARTFGLGARGQHVTWLQQRLGFTGKDVDGVFGQLTEGRLRALQSANGLVADGIFGADSFAPVGWANPAPL